MKTIYNIGEAAALLGWSKYQMRKAFDKYGSLGYRLPGCQTRRIPHDKLEKFVKHWNDHQDFAARHDLKTDPKLKLSSDPLAK